MAWTPQYTVKTRGEGTLSRTATMQVQSIWDTQAHAVQVAKECVFISGPFSMPHLAAMMAANPQLIFGPYLKSYQNPVGSDPSGSKYPNKWYVHFKDGTKAKQGGQFVNWLMETGFYTETRIAATVAAELSSGSIAASSWAEFHVKDSVAKINSVNAQAAQAGTKPFKALWFDTNDTFSADATPGFWTGTNPGWNPHTNLAYTKPQFVDMAHWVGDMATNQAGVTVNPERLWTVANGLRSVSIGDHYDMAMAEGWMVSGGLGGGLTRGTAGWDHSADLALQCQAKGCMVEIMDWGVSGDTLATSRRKRRFVAASYLIINRSLATMQFTSLRGDTPHIETARDTALYGDITIGGTTQPLDLGAPLAGQSPTTAAGHAVAVGAGNGQASAAGLRARLFDAGTVLVNPTAAAINYKASKTYTLVPQPGGSGASYVAGNLISVPAGDSVILTTTGGTGGTAPADTRLPELLGTAREGQKIRIRKGAFSGSPAPIITDQIQQSANGTTGWTNIAGELGPVFAIPFGSGGTPTTYAADDFSDAQTDTWATADTGGTWTVEQGAAADFDKITGRGTLSHAAANTAKSATLNIAQADVDAVVSVSFPTAAAGGNMQASLMVRWADASNYLRLNAILVASGGHITVGPDKVIAGASTSLGTAKDLGVYSVGTDVKMRIRTEGNNIKGKAWLASGSEPAGWDWDITDSSITAAGKIGLRSFRTSANTNTSPQTRFDNLTVTSLVGTVTGLVGQFLRTHETATNSAGTDTADSAALGAIVAGAPTDPIWDPNNFPSITGSPAEGATLTATPGTVNATPAATFAYQWETSATSNPGSWSDIAGETASTHAPASGTAGAYRRVRVSATSGAVTTQQWSDPIGPIVATDVPPSFSVNPAITGTTEAGQTLTATLGTPAGSPAPSVGTPQWQRSTNGGATYQDIPGENDLTYLLQLGDQGTLIRISVPLSNRAGDFVGSSAAVGPITLPTTLPPLSLSVTVE